MSEENSIEMFEIGGIFFGIVVCVVCFGISYLRKEEKHVII
jgi:hypothetical protein